MDDIELKFGHQFGDLPSVKRNWHKSIDKSSISTSYCNNQKEICCCGIPFNFDQICKKCWKMLSKKEQEELVHYFCVKRLKG